MKRTPLFDLHTRLGARMVPFAGYLMPLQFAGGILSEHLRTRSHSGLFDVSHMGQLVIGAEGAAMLLETLMPTDVVDLPSGRQRYGLLLNEQGGIVDDMMVANYGDVFSIVVNASRKEADLAVFRQVFGSQLEYIENRALLALQGPQSVSALKDILPASCEMSFMDCAKLDSEFGELWVSRSGYTGEDGFEISVEQEQAEALATALIASGETELAGLGARDTLRLEAGLCLYGSDIDETTSPVEADLSWAISKARRASGARAGGFPGTQRVLAEIGSSTERRRVGILSSTRAALRAGTKLFADAQADVPIGVVTSGGFGPSINKSIAMGYLSILNVELGREVWAEVRGKRILAHVSPMPFQKTNYKVKRNQSI